MIQPLSSYTPGPPDCSKITALLYIHMGAFLQCHSKGLDVKENKASTGNLSTCLNQSPYKSASCFESIEALGFECIINSFTISTVFLLFNLEAIIVCPL